MLATSIVPVANDVVRLTLRSVDAALPPVRRTGHSDRITTRALFLVIVALPVLLVSVYYAFIASDQFASETRFLVRSPQRAAAGVLNGFLQSTGFIRAQDDSYAVSEFIRSRTALAQLEKSNGLREIFSRPEADFFARFPQFWSSGSEEALFRHYLKFVNVKTDNTSGVTTLEVKAFRADDARNLATALLQHSEDLINRLNNRARQDAIRHAQVEIENAEARLADVQRRLTDFRNREAMIDPDKQSDAILDLMSKLSLDAAEKNARLQEIQKQTPSSPQISALRANVAATEEQIGRERSKIVGSKSSIVLRMSEYDHLLLERELAARMVGSATTSLENARLDAQRQQLYLERIVEPHLPDRARYPRGIYTVLTVLMGTFALFGILKILLGHLLERRM